MTEEERGQRRPNLTHRKDSQMGTLAENHIWHHPQEAAEHTLTRLLPTSAENH